MKKKKNTRTHHRTQNSKRRMDDLFFKKSSQKGNFVLWPSEISFKNSESEILGNTQAGESSCQCSGKGDAWLSHSSSSSSSSSMTVTVGLGVNQRHDLSVPKLGTRNRTNSARRGHRITTHSFIQSTRNPTIQPTLQRSPTADRNEKHTHTHTPRSHWQKKERNFVEYRNIGKLFIKKIPNRKFSENTQASL